MSLNRFAFLTGFGLVGLISGCGGEEAPTPQAKEKKPLKTEAAKPVAEEPPEAVQQPLEGGPFPDYWLPAWFWKGNDGKPNPGPARLEIWRTTLTVGRRPCRRQ